jgi:hypothetical protein
MHASFLSLTALAAGVTVPAQLPVLRLPPVADVTADQDNPATNYGSDAEVGFGKAYATRNNVFVVWFLRGHLQFDLTGKPLPDRARLRWYQSRSSAAGCLDVTLHRVTQPWVESTVTWNNKPTHDPAVVARVCVGDSFNLGWKTFDVTTLVHDWMNNVHPNFGLVVRDPTETTAGAARPGFGHSRESTLLDRRPYLELTWGLKSVGKGCDPNNRAPLLDLDSGDPTRGQSYTLLASALGGSTSSIWFLGSSSSQWGGVPLPLDLTGVGYPGCWLWVSGQFLATGSTSSRGEEARKFDVPNDNALQGALLFHQVLAFDRNLRLSNTNGLQVTVF